MSVDTTSKGLRAILTHSIRDLLTYCVKYEREFENLFDYGRKLDKEYIPSRYPNGLPSGSPYEYYDKKDAERCINYAESISKEVGKFIRS